MSGCVMIVSADAAVRARGVEALSRLRHLDEWTEASLEAGEVWAGACGRPGLCDVALWDAADVEAGAERYLAVVAGEILNLRAVAARLGLAPAMTPAQVVAAACERWGGDLFPQLEGVYRLAVYDRREKALVAGVDARGLGTIHGVTIGDDLFVASEVKAFTVDSRFVPKLSEQSLAELVTLGWVTAGRGLFDGVESPPLRCHIEASAGGLAIVRHADDRDMAGGTLRGDAYLERMEDAVRDICRDTFTSDDVLLPLTGGIDSRLLAVAVPDGRTPACFSFGAPDDYDVHVAALVAGRRGYRHTVIPVEPAYVARFATQASWLGEGCINPVSNITGSLMDRVGPGEAFVSGQGGEVGRRFLKSRLMVPDWHLLDATPLEFERRLMSEFVSPLFAAEDLTRLLGDRAEAMRDTGFQGVHEGLERTRGLHPIDRIELHVSDAEFWEGRPWLALAGIQVPARAPFHTQRWLGAVLSGDPSERIDDVVRLRLIARMDPVAGRLPSSLTRLSLPATAQVLSALRRASRVAVRPSTPAVPGGATGERESDEHVASRPPGSAAGRLAARSAAAGARLLETAVHRLHPRVEAREEWLRTRSWDFVEDTLRGDRLAERGIVEAGAVGALLDRCRDGEDLARQIGVLLGLELWHRLFVDGDLDPHEEARR